MTWESRIIVVGLAVFGAMGLLTTLVMPFISRRATGGTAAQRAARLADLRLLPVAVALVTSLIASTAFVAFEPNFDGESLGLAVPVLAAFAGVLIVAAAGRGLRLIMTTRSTIRGWLLGAESVDLPGISVPAFAIDADFPVVAVIGLRKPRLVIARSVLSSCNAEELEAILAHEQSHIDRRDNLRRLLIATAPDVLTWLPISTRMIDAWREAAEDAADDAAATRGDDGGVRLAAALLKVARLAPGQVRSPLPASTLYRGEDLDRRVRRLVTARDAAGAATSGPWRLRITFAVLVAGSLTLLESVHGLLEGLIHRLP